jgi:uncharacterized delta-60 repeat protein
MADGSTDTNFTAGVTSTVNADTTVRAVVVQASGKVVLAGRFTRVNGLTFPGLARLNPDGSVDLTFVPSLVLQSTPGSPFDLINAVSVQSDGKLIVAGYFALGPDLHRAQLARLNPDGSVDPSFDPGNAPIQKIYNNSLYGSINALALSADGTALFVAGAFTHWDGLPYHDFVRLNLGPILVFRSVAQAPDRQVELAAGLSGAPSVVLQSSDDLVLHWVPLDTNRVDAAPMQWSYRDSSKYAHHFYRTVAP